MNWNELEVYYAYIQVLSEFQLATNLQELADAPKIMLFWIETIAQVVEWWCMRRPHLSLTM